MGLESAGSISVENGLLSYSLNWQLKVKRLVLRIHT